MDFGRRVGPDLCDFLVVFAAKLVDVLIKLPVSKDYLLIFIGGYTKNLY
jgi:hypothetical protein